MVVLAVVDDCTFELLFLFALDDLLLLSLHDDDDDHGQVAGLPFNK